MRRELKRFKQWWISLLSGILFLLVSFQILLLKPLNYIDFSLTLFLTFFFIGALRLYYVFRNYKYVKRKDWFMINGFIEVSIIFVPLFTYDYSDFLQVYAGFILIFRSLIGIGIAISFYYSNLKSWLILLLAGFFGFIMSFSMLWEPFPLSSSFLFEAFFAFLFVGILQIGIAFQMRSLSLKYKR